MKTTKQIAKIKNKLPFGIRNELLKEAKTSCSLDGETQIAPQTFTTNEMQAFGDFGMKSGLNFGREAEREEIIKFLKKNKDCTIGWLIKKLEDEK